MRSVFISYARDDQAFARTIAEYLSSAGLSVFFDSEAIVAGDSWSARISSALRSADAVVVLLSSNSRRSTYVQDELQTALESKKVVIPILLDAQATQNWLWPLLGTRQAVRIDMSLGDLHSQLRPLAEALAIQWNEDVAVFSRSADDSAPLPLSPPPPPQASRQSSAWRTVVIAAISAALGSLLTWLLR